MRLNVGRVIGYCNSKCTHWQWSNYTETDGGVNVEVTCCHTVKLLMARSDDNIFVSDHCVKLCDHRVQNYCCDLTEGHDRPHVGHWPIILQFAVIGKAMPGTNNKCAHSLSLCGENGRWLFASSQEEEGESLGRKYTDRVHRCLIDLV